MASMLTCNDKYSLSRHFFDLPEAEKLLIEKSRGYPRVGSELRVSACSRVESAML